MQIGFLALTDAAPLIVAQERGYFTERGLAVELHREIGWATVRDKIIYGELDAAQAPAPMLWSAQLGISCPPCEVLTAFVLNLNGNAITLSRALWNAGVRDDVALRELARTRRGQPLTFGVVFPFSSHHILLREWLRSIAIDPDRDVRIVVVPPAQVFRNIAAGTIDGFCAGEPWNTLAIREGAGWCRLCSATHTPSHIEKVLMVRTQFAEEQSAEHLALLGALHVACAWCDEPQNRETLAELLASPRYLNMPVATLLPALLDKFDFGSGSSLGVRGFHVFHAGNANLPDANKASAIQDSLLRAGLLQADLLPPHLPRRLFREDLYREIPNLPTHHAIATTRDLRGVVSQ